MREMTKAISGFSGRVFGKLPATRKRKDRQRNRLGRSQHAPASQEPKARWRCGSADRTTPEQVWQVPGLRELRFAESQQILPLIGNRKPATRFREMRNSNFLVPPPLGVGVFGKLLAARKRKDCQRIGSADRPLPSRSGRHLDYESFRLAESQQILPLIGNREPASDRGHWLQPAPCSSRRRSCPGGERGDRQSSVPADSTPSRASPTGRRIGGYDYKTEAIRQPRADNYTHFREMRNSNFPSPGGRSVREITSREETERPPENRLGRSQHAPACPRNRKPAGDLVGRSNRSRAGRAGSWTTRVQAHRVPADPTADRKPKAYQ